MRASGEARGEIGSDAEIPQHGIERMARRDDAFSEKDHFFLDALGLFAGVGGLGGDFVFGGAANVVRGRDAGGGDG